MNCCLVQLVSSGDHDVLYAAVWCGYVWCCVVGYGVWQCVVWHGIVLCSVVWRYVTARRSVVLCGVVWCDVLRSVVCGMWRGVW